MSYCETMLLDFLQDNFLIVLSKPIDAS